MIAQTRALVVRAKATVDVRERAPGQPLSRRAASTEPPPTESPVEVVHSTECAAWTGALEEDFVGSTPSPAAMRAVAVVPVREVAAKTVGLGGGGDQPEVSE